MGIVFVDEPDAISKTLASTVSKKACLVHVTFVDPSTGLTQIYHGQGGLFKGNRLLEEPAAKKQKRVARVVSFEGFSSFEATPVTASKPCIA